MTALSESLLSQFGPSRLPVVAYQGRRDRVPEPHVVSWSKLRRRLLRHDPRPEKDGLAWSPALYPAGATRGNESVLAVSCFVADIDDGTPVTALRERWRLPDGSRLAFALHSSYSSTLATPKYRVVFPLSCPVPASAWPALHRTLALSLFGGRMAWGEHLGGWKLRAEGCPVDPACKDAARLYYLPACPPGAIETAFADAGDGAALDPWAFPAVVLPDAPKAVRRERPAMPGREGAGLHGLSPGDDFNARGDALSVLVDAGWSLAHESGGVVYLRRPGKRGDWSASYGCGGGSTFHCFTSSAPPFDADESYSPFAVYAMLRHGGSFADAARALKAAGYGGAGR